VKEFNWSIRECGLNRAVSTRQSGGRGLPNSAPAFRRQVPAGDPSCAPRADCGAKFVRCGVLVAEVGAARGNRGQAWCSHACLHGVRVRLPLSARPPLRPNTAPLTVQCAPHCVRKESKIEMVCRGGGRATALADKGVVKELCAYASTWTSSNVPCLHLKRGCTPLSLLPSPSPGVCLAHFFFEPAPDTRKHTLLPPNPDS